jgi:hypothetical protein
VGGVREPFTAAGPASAPAGLQPLPDRRRIEPETGEDRLRRPARLEQRQQDMLGPDRVVTETLGL